jgi:plasmid stabilization system protein ParE
MKRYELSVEARFDLGGIRRYLAPAPKTIQVRILDELEQTFWRIGDFPLIGRAEPEMTIRYGVHTRSTLSYPYRIYSFPERLPVAVFAILHGAQDIATILRTRTASFL